MKRIVTVLAMMVLMGLSSSAMAGGPWTDFAFRGGQQRRYNRCRSDYRGYYRGYTGPWTDFAFHGGYRHYDRFYYGWPGYYRYNGRHYGWSVGIFLGF